MGAGIFNTFRSLLAEARRRPGRVVPLHSKYGKGDNAIAGFGFWDTDLADAANGLGPNPARPLSDAAGKFRLLQMDFTKLRGDEFDALDLVPRSGSYAWVPGEGPQITDGDLELRLGCATSGAQPMQLAITGRMSWETSGGAPVAGNGAQVGLMNADDDFTGVGLVYNTAWYLGIVVEDSGVIDTNSLRPRPETDTDRRFCMSAPIAWSDLSSGYILAQLEDPSWTGVNIEGAYEIFGNFGHTGRMQPDGRFMMRATRTSGSAAATLHELKYSYQR